MSKWIESLNPKGQYRGKCRLAFNKFIRFLKEKYGLDMNGDVIIAKHTENRKSDDKRIKYFFDDLIPPFMTWLEIDNSHNSVVVQVAMVKSFFKHLREPLQVQGNIKFRESKKRYHAYTKDELTKMVSVGDLEERALIMLGAQLGIRVHDFVSMKRNSILEAYQNSNGEFPLEFEIETEKESIISVGHMSKEVYEALQFYWASIKESEYAFPSNNDPSVDIPISDQRANDILKNCWLKAFPERSDIKNKIRFHELRSFKISTLVNLGTNQWVIQKMTGKKVSPDINVYLAGINFKEVFMKAEQALSLTHITTNNHGAIEELRKDNDVLKTQLKAVTEQLQRNAERLDKWEKDIAEFNELKKELEDDIKIVREGGLVVAYAGEETKERMLEEIRNRQKQKEQTANSD
ncbi:tyrosine-type recombinase/integrase [Candidatus Bathyarchaeota archaeon]|nr:tyrosine-type recombinase/integrase [Candidatus Bathyarchaeota archaeon]